MAPKSKAHELQRDREERVRELLAAGMTTKQMAWELAISPARVSQIASRLKPNPLDVIGLAEHTPISSEEEEGVVGVVDWIYRALLEIADLSDLAESLPQRTDKENEAVWIREPLWRDIIARAKRVMHRRVGRPADSGRSESWRRERWVEEARSEKKRLLAEAKWKGEYLSADKAEQQAAEIVSKRPGCDRSPSYLQDHISRTGKRSRLSRSGKNSPN